MKTAIATVCLSGDFNDKIDAIARAGFDGVEIFENDLLAYDRSPKDIGNMVRDRGLEITTYQPFRNFEGLPEPLRSRAFERAERKFDLMEELGTDLLMICSNCLPEALGGIDRAAADFHELGERAAKRGFRVGFEALAWAPIINDHRDSWEIVRRANHPNIGLVLDAFHSLARGIDVDTIRAIPGEKIFLVQLCDAPKMQLDYLNWSRHFRNMPGEGDLPVFEMMQAIEATGYDGIISLEIFNDQFRSGSARSVALDGRRSLINLEDRLAASNPGRSKARLLPPRQPCRGIEFVEFTVDDAYDAKLTDFVRALGFQKYGVHKSKQVTVWKQGDVKLVINKEQQSFAHSFYKTHGPSVCAVCLRVDDAQSAFERARGLLATPFMQSIVKDELQIPAIQGVGDSLIYFIDDKSRLGSLWSVDFDLCASETDFSGAGIQKIDHIAQSTRFDETLFWVQFYTSIFKLEKLPGQDIADPAGLVWSQVVESADGALRIALNGAQGLRTQSGRFLNEFDGSGTQHLAFNTSDIFATAKALKASGLKTIAIPGNYYDDLLARLALDQSFVDELVANGIMYDRDAAGDYLQIYTETFNGRFFFEIVERRTYAGFGAANAPIRLAAQARLARNDAMPTH